jgi:hypothetical protein
MNAKGESMADDSPPDEHPREHPHPTREGTTRVHRLGGADLYVTVNRYSDGRPCEVLTRLGLGTDAEIGPETAHGLLRDLARVVSLALQHGVPAARLSAALRRSRYAPAPPVLGGNAATSIGDAIGRMLSAGDDEGTP